VLDLTATYLSFIKCGVLSWIHEGMNISDVLRIADTAEKLRYGYPSARTTCSPIRGRRGRLQSAGSLLLRSSKGV
jgi:hypothetical protein